MSDLTHGIEVLEIDGGARPITTIRTSIIGLVGTASQGPLNTPVLITGQKDAADTFGTGGSIAAALEPGLCNRVSQKLFQVHKFLLYIHISNALQ